LEYIFAFIIKHSQNFDWRILRQNYSDISLYIIKKMLKFIQSAFKMDFYVSSKLQKYPNLTRLCYPNPLDELETSTVERFHSWLRFWNRIEGCSAPTRLYSSKATNSTQADPMLHPIFSKDFATVTAFSCPILRTYAG